jgi:hypothetical protein
MAVTYRHLPSGLEEEVRWHRREAARHVPGSPPTAEAVETILTWRRGPQGPGMRSDASGRGPVGQAVVADLPSSGLVLLPVDPRSALSVLNHVCLTRREAARLRYTGRYWRQGRPRRAGCSS